MTVSRKQREIAKRHTLFLEIGKRILDEEGFHMLSMERIAELAEYSKGTVYQHFTCKEEILIQLCNKAMSQMLMLFETAINIEGSNRDRIVALFYAQNTWACMGGNQSAMLQHLSMHGVKQKVSEQSLQEHDKLEQTLFGLVKNIVDQAIEDGDLKASKHMQSTETVFGLWSLCTGGQTLQNSDLPLDEFGIANPNLTLLRTLTLILDGLNWQPLHKEAQFKKLLKHLENDVFTASLRAQAGDTESGQTDNQ